MMIKTLIGIISFFVVVVGCAVAVVVVDAQSSLNPSQPFLPDVFGLNKYNLTEDVAPSIAPWNLVQTWGQFFGAFPEIIPSSGTWCFGGIPQRANLTLHRKRIIDFIQSRNLSSDFSAMIIVDYESWHFTWNLTNNLYKNASRAYVKEQFPSQSSDAAFVEREAATQYKNGVIAFLNTTVFAIREVLPKSKIGFYGYGGVMGYWVNVTQRQELNDEELNFLWPMIDVLAPSIYLPYKSGKDVAFQRNQLYITQNIQEATRLKNKYSSSAQQKTMLTAPYAWHRYHPGEPSALQLLTEQDMMLEYHFPLYAASPSNIRVDYVIMWGDESASIADEKAVFQLFVKDKTVFVPSSTTKNENNGLFRMLDHNKNDDESLTKKHSEIRKASGLSLPPWKVCSL